MNTHKRPGGVLGVAARRAVVAGTAAAVSGSAVRNQQKKIAAEEERHKASVQPVEDNTTKELEDLATLKAKGVLTDVEFTAKKKQILGL